MREGMVSGCRPVAGRGEKEKISLAGVGSANAL